MQGVHVLHMYMYMCMYVMYFIPTPQVGGVFMYGTVLGREGKMKSVATANVL